ncbi:MAG: hypothetical protein ACW98A_16655, partial [Candidatus Hodarchaeales archaeon]
LYVFVIIYFIIPLLYFLESISGSKPKKFKYMLRSIFLMFLSVSFSSIIAYAYFYSLMYGISEKNLYESAGMVVVAWLLVFIIYHILGRFFRLTPPLRDIIIPNNKKEGKKLSIPEKALDSIDDYIKERIIDHTDQNNLSREYNKMDTEYLEKSLNNIRKSVDSQKSELIQVKSDIIKQKIDKNSTKTDFINSTKPDSYSDQSITSNNSIYTRDRLLELLFNKNDWIIVSLFYYFYLGISLASLLILLYINNYSLLNFFDYFVFFSMIIAIGYGFYRYYNDDIANQRLLNYVNLYRVLMYLAIAFFHSTFISTLNMGAQNSSDFLPVIITLAVWSIPLVAYAIYYWYKELKTKEQRTLLRLNRQPLAFKLTKFYITSHLPKLKASMVNVTPLTVDKQFKMVLSEDIFSLEEAMVENGIEINSKDGLILFVMRAVEPLRSNLRELLGDKYSKILIQTESDEETSPVNINDVWESLNKSFLRWDSSMQN